MRPAAYPFAAIVGQQEMKLALLLAAVDWHLGVLLRGDKGSGKTTTARALAALLPAPARFVNLPIGATEDRLLGGLHLERTMQGDPALQPGLLAEAHGGVLYVDEVNLLPAHLGDALLDAAASGVHTVEREGLSASHAAEFVLLGSMNPEEGSLRPQLLDRFALSVEIAAPLDPAERQLVLERRLAFDRDPQRCAETWSEEEQALRLQIMTARAALTSVACPPEVLEQISRSICEAGVRSLRADLAATRASLAYAALCGEPAVTPAHVDAVLPLVLAHRMQRRQRQTPPPPTPQQQPTPGESKNGSQEQGERVFAPLAVEAPAVRGSFTDQRAPGGSASASEGERGVVVGSRAAESPRELDLRASLQHALRETGDVKLRRLDLHERMRAPKTGTRYLFVVDASGSQAAQQRMRRVKGAAAALLERSLTRDDEVMVIAFRGTAAQVVLEPTRALDEALAAFEYLPTGGRTPLAHALELAAGYVTPTTLLLLFTDGGANVPLDVGDAWEDALAAAARLRCAAVVIEAGVREEQAGSTRQLAERMNARCLSLSEFVTGEDLRLEALPRLD